MTDHIIPEKIDILEIMKILPHRYPFVLIDRVTEVDPGKDIVALKNVTINEPFFQGHFPDQPIMPGVLILEAMAQAGGVLAYFSNPKPESRQNLYFAAIDKARFRKQIVPGDQLVIKVELLRQKRSIVKMAARAFVGDELAAEAELMAAIG